MKKIYFYSGLIKIYCSVTEDVEMEVDESAWSHYI